MSWTWTWHWDWTLLLDLGRSWLRCLASPGATWSVFGCAGPAQLLP